MAEPTIVLQLNEGSEGAPTWVTILTAARWTGPDSTPGTLTDPFAAPILDADEVFADNAAFPNDGELWHDNATDVQVVTAGRNTDRNILRILETGGSDPTSDPPEFTAYDDAADAGNRTDPTVWLLAGTAGSSNISLIRAGETTSGAVGGDWATQVHDAAPTGGSALDGNKSGEKEVTAAILAASGNKTMNLAWGVPHDATSGLSSFVYSVQYTFE